MLAHTLYSRYATSEFKGFATTYALLLGSFAGDQGARNSKIPLTKTDEETSIMANGTITVFPFLTQCKANPLSLFLGDRQGMSADNSYGPEHVMLMARNYFQREGSVLMHNNDNGAMSMSLH